MITDSNKVDSTEGACDMDDWNKTKTDILKDMARDPEVIDSLLEQLSSYAEAFGSENIGDYGLPLDTGTGRDMMRMVVLSWFVKLGQQLVTTQ